MTGQYNDALRQALPEKGISFHEIPRLEQTETPISASNVRACLQAGDLEALKELVPQTTYEYLEANGFLK